MAARFVKAELCKAWEKTGKSEFLKLCKSLIATPGCFFTTEEPSLKRVVYELIWHCLNGSLKLEQLISTLTELADMHPEIPSLLADIFGILDIETGTNDNKAAREKLMSVISKCYGIVPETLLKCRLDQDTLENLGLLSSKVAFQQKYVKLKTKLYYKQQKFNLLREETEGYSKLITELNVDSVEDRCYLVVLENIKSLIGCFNLDPNRVLDIILESFECRPEQKSLFVPLLQKYMSDKATLCHMLGFKFHFYQQTHDSETPSSLYQIVAILLHHNLVDLDTLYPQLSPSNSDILEQHKKELFEARQYSRRLNAIVLSDKPNDKEGKDEKDNKLEQRTNNQKLGLCEACIKIGDWEHAKQIIDRLPPYFAVGHQPVANALCDLVNYMIEPIYVSRAGLPDILMKKRTQPQSMHSISVSQATTWTELVQKAFPLVYCLGPNLACNTVLMGKLVRLAKNFIEKNFPQKCQNGAEVTDEVFRGFLTLMDEVILPSLSQLPSNCCMAEEIWAYMKHLKYKYRYRLYGQWKNDKFNLHPKLIRIRADVIDKAKYIMKRLAKENVKQMGRQIGKLSHSNPGIVFEFILSQIQIFDNFIGPVVDSLKFLTGLSYDIVSYCIIEALANPEKERLKHDDTNLSLWLQSLANFCGTVFRKYQIDLAGITQYVANQLKAGKSYDLLILREIVQKMAGIEVSEEVTDNQLEAMTGGELLKQEGGYFTQVRNTKKSSVRLKEALLEHDLAIPLCLLIAQQRNSIIFIKDMEDNRHIKLIGKLYDQCQDTLVQFITFLSLQMSPEEFHKRLPPIDELVTNYQVSADVAFALWRPTYASAIQSKYEELLKIDRSEKQDTNSQSAKVSCYIEACNSVMNPVMDLIIPLNPPKVWDEIGIQFYTTFWSLTMYDLHVPTAAYESQRAALRAQLIAIDENKELAQSSSKKKKEKDRCLSLIEKLKEEEKKQEEHVKLVIARLKQEKDTWFSLKTVPKQSMITSVLQLCLFPRCCFTTNDAVYCAKFLHILHHLKTPNFSSLICYDRIFTEATWAISSCTENEAHRFGRFLCTVLDDIMRWHSDKAIFEKECANFPGFVTVFRVPKSDSSSPPADSLDFENYRHVVHKWQYSLCVSTANNIESKDYMQIRNALIVLTKMLPHFPRVLRFGLALERRVERLCQEEKDKRPDLFALAMGYIGQLRQRSKTWIEESDFHNIPKKETQPSKPVDKPEQRQDSEPSASVKHENEVPAKTTNDTKESAPQDKKVVNKEKRSPHTGTKDDHRENKEVTDAKEAKEEKAREHKEMEKPGTKEKKETMKENAKEKKTKTKENGKDNSAIKEGEKDNKPKEVPIKDAKTKSTSKDRDSKEKEKRHKENKDGKSPRDEKLSKEEREQLKKEEKERRREEKERAKQLADELEKERSREERERIKEEKREAKAAEKLVEKERLRREKEVSSHRHSSEPSPKHDDRDVKRRKLEVKEQIHHTTDYWDKPHKLPMSQQSPDHDADYDGSLERDKRDRKRVSRDRSVDGRDYVHAEAKRYRAEDVQDKQNGDPRDRSKDRNRSRSSDREGDGRIKDNISYSDNLSAKSSRKNSPEKSEKEKRKSDKHNKKSKRH